MGSQEGCRRRGSCPRFLGCYSSTECLQNFRKRCVERWTDLNGYLDLLYADDVTIAIVGSNEEVVCEVAHANAGDIERAVNKRGLSQGRSKTRNLPMSLAELPERVFRRPPAFGWLSAKRRPHRGGNHTAAPREYTTPTGGRNDGYTGWPSAKRLAIQTISTGGWNQ